MNENMSENTRALGFLPPLGWNSWNTFTWDINESLIFEIADCMVKDGYKDAGYEYLVIDDCWSLKERNENGHLVADPKKFPHGMKAVADYIHDKGLKFGIVDAQFYFLPATGVRITYITGFANPVPICTAPHRISRITGNRFKKSPCPKLKKKRSPVPSATMTWTCWWLVCTVAVTMILSVPSVAVPIRSTKPTLLSGL